MTCSYVPKLQAEVKQLREVLLDLAVKANALRLNVHGSSETRIRLTEDLFENGLGPAWDVLGDDWTKRTGTKTT